MDLEQIRQEIDQVDQDLVALLEKRMQLVTQVTAYKKAIGKAVLDSKRELAVLEKVASRVQDKDFEKAIVRTFADMMAASRAYQEEHLSDDK